MNTQLTAPLRERHVVIPATFARDADAYAMAGAAERTRAIFAPRQKHVVVGGDGR